MENINETEKAHLKECKDCGQILTLDKFHCWKGHYKSYCKVCSNKRSVQHKKDNAEHWNQYQRTYYSQNKDKFMGNHTRKGKPIPCGVYKITCLITNDTYVGSSKNILHRIYRHKRNVGRSKQKDLAKLIKTYGWNDDTFKWEVLEYTSIENRIERERFYKADLQPTLNRTK